MHVRVRGLLLGAMASVLVQGASGADQAGTQAAAGAAGNAPQAAGKSITTPLYTVKDGNRVDPNTLNGWKTWRALACERCHGASQEGLVGPSLVNSLKVLTKEQFHTTIMQGRLPKGMPNFDGSAMVQKNWEGLYAYLKGRSDGNILPGHLYPIEPDSNSAQNQPK
jgi:mono/diheme cytochrome c family protein